MSSSMWRARLVGVDLSDEARSIFDDLITENERLRDQLEDLRLAAAAATRAAPSAPASAGERATGAPARGAILDTRQFAPDRVLITASASGQAKRTELNSYYRQRRGGVGNYDLKTREDDPAQFLVVASVGDSLLILTQTGKAYRTAVADIPATERNARGDSLHKLAGMPAEERIAALLALSEADLQKYIVFGSQTGFVKRMRGHYFGATLEPGKVVMDPRQTGGPAAAMCLSNGVADILMVSQGGMAVRFNISTAPLQAAPGIKLRQGDRLAGLAAVMEESAVGIVTKDGLGTRRLMEGFTPNKSPGAAGKIIMKSEEIVGIALAPDDAELVCLTAFAKVVRFSADEIPAKTAPVQGVDIVDVRGDAVTTVAILE